MGIDCTVRFWKISKEQNAQACCWRKEGACKDISAAGDGEVDEEKVAAST